MDFCRIKDLEVGDKFMYHGIWYQVMVKNEEGLYIDNISRAWQNMTKTKHLYRIGVKSQMFVQVANPIA